MVSKILVDSGNYGTIPSGSYSTVVLPNAGAVPFPTYIVSGSYSGSYTVAYWDGTTLSPMFNQNDPRCGTWSVVVRSVSEDTFYLFSFLSATGKYILTVFLIDPTDVRAGTFSPSTTKIYSLIVNGSPDVYSIYNVDTINSTTFFIRTTTECIILDLNPTATSVKRVSVASSGIRLNGYQPCALLKVSTGFAILDIAAGRAITVSGSGSLQSNLAYWWPTTDGYYFAGRHEKYANTYVAVESYRWGDGKWNLETTQYVVSFLHYSLISFSGDLEDAYNNSTVPCALIQPEYNPPHTGDLQYRNQLLYNPFNSVIIGNYGCTGIGGNYTRVLTYYEGFNGAPCAGKKSIYYDAFPAPKDAAAFQQALSAYSGLPTGSGASLSNNYSTSSVGYSDLHAPIVNKYNNYILTGGSTIYELKPEINGHYTKSIGINPFAMCPI